VTELEIRVPETVYRRPSVEHFEDFLSEKVGSEKAKGIVRSIVTDRIAELAQQYVAKMRRQVIEVLHIRNRLRAHYQEVIAHFARGGTPEALPARLQPAAFDALFSELAQAMDRLKTPESFLAGVREAEATGTLLRPWEEHPTVPDEHPTVPDEPPPGYPAEPAPRPPRSPSGGGGGGRLPPIRDEASLRRAIAEVGARPKKGTLPAKTHIVERAKELGHGLIKVVPEDWRIEVEAAQDLYEEPRIVREERAERDYYNDVKRRAGPDPGEEQLDEAMHDLLLRNNAPYELPTSWRADLQKSPEFGARVAQQAAFAARDPLFAANGFEIQFTAPDGFVFMTDAVQFHDDETLEFFEFKDPLEKDSVETYRASESLRDELADTMIGRAEAARSLGPGRCRGWTYDTSLPEMNELLFDVLDEALPDGSDLRNWIRVADPKGRKL